MPLVSPWPGISMSLSPNGHKGQRWDLGCPDIGTKSRPGLRMCSRFLQAGVLQCSRLSFHLAAVGSLRRKLQLLQPRTGVRSRPLLFVPAFCWPSTVAAPADKTTTSAAANACVNCLIKITPFFIIRRGALSARSRRRSAPAIKLGVRHQVVLESRNWPEPATDTSPEGKEFFNSAITQSS